MKKYEYLTKTIQPDKLGYELELFGQDGFELINIIPMQRIIQPRLGLPNQQPVIETQFLMIFKKEIL
jgi:hypothetical protein